jgi:octopine/nopaline transport system permease protein
MEVFICAALIYLILNFLVVRVVAWIEHRLSPHLRERPKDVPVKQTPEPISHS